MDVDAVLARLDLAGAPDGPGPDGLATLQRAHVRAIPFENLDILLGRPIALDPDAVEDKLVTRRRGGYCHEHVVLFCGLLAALGYAAHPVLARMGHQAQDAPPTHAGVIVDLGGQLWLADVGLGGGPLAPLALADGAEHGEPGGWRHRTVALGDGAWRLETRLGERWSATHTFAVAPSQAAAIIEGNRYVSTDPASLFVGQPLLIDIDERRRMALVGAELRISSPAGDDERRVLSAAGQLAAIEDDFGVVLSAAERRGVSAALRGRGP